MLLQTGPGELDQDAAKGAILKVLVKASILLGLAYYFANMVFNDNLKNYSNQSEWLALMAAGLFMLLGVATLISFLVGRAQAQKVRHNNHDHAHHSDHGEADEHIHHEYEHEHSHSIQTETSGYIHVEHHEHEHGHGHEHGHTSWTLLFVVAIPLALGVLLPSKPLGAAAISGNSLPSGGGMVTNGSGPPVDEPQSWNIMEWQLALSHNVHPSEWFTGRKVDIVGFVVHQPEVPDGNFLVGRFVMYHCAADARGTALLVNSPEAERLPSDTWVHIQGIMRVENIGGGPTLHVYATQINDKVGAPQEPYLRPYIRTDYEPGLASANKQDGGVKPLITATPVSVGSPPSPLALEYEVTIQSVPLSVRLPGDAWTKSIPDDYPGAISERWDNQDQSLIFVVFLFTDYKEENIASVQRYAEDLSGAFQVDSLYAPTKADYHGFQATRISGVGRGDQLAFPAKFQFEQYWLMTEKGLLEIAVGSTEARWQTDGEALVKAVLDSVRF